MNKIMTGINATIISVIFLCFSGCASAEEKQYELAALSEAYNIHYLYHQNFTEPIRQDSMVYIDAKLPAQFVVELGALKEGESSLLIYNNNKELLIAKSNRRYTVNGKRMKNDYLDDTKLSLYFVNNKVVLYVDEKQAVYVKLNFDHRMKIGVKCTKDGRYNYNYLNCYKPCEFKNIDYGQLMDEGVWVTRKGKLLQQNVGEDYSLRLSPDITCLSQYSIRFEYRFEDSKKEGKSKTQRGRSEIAGVSSSSLMGKWVIEFDFFVPHETADDSLRYDMITQLHDHSTQALSPAFSMLMKNGELICRLRGDSIPVEQWEQHNKPAGGTHILPLGYLKKDTWHHVKIYLKLAYQRSMMPQTIVWVDSKKVLETNLPNCYNYMPKKAGAYDYIKFGIYKWSWLGLKRKPQGTDRRIYYFDNYKVKY